MSVDRTGKDGAVLHTRGLTVGYHAARRRPTVVLDQLDLSLPRGELTCLLGPNGTGKSTLLRTLAGMQPALAGEVLLDGQPLARLPAIERARRLAVVLTDRIDAGLLTGADLVALGRHPHTGWTGRLSPSDRAAVRWAMDAVDATRFAERRVAELSDGERQRVAIARALAQQPGVLALDEPTAYVDVPRRVELTQTLRHLARECRLAVLLTTHDLDLAVRVADRVWLIEPANGDQPARLTVGAPEDLVLSGAIARAFRARDVRFDLLRGTFVPNSGTAGTIRVVGDGPAALWAGRALEREGFGLVHDDATADAQVQVLDGPRWRLQVADLTSDHDLLGDLLAAARAVPALAAAQDRANDSRGTLADRAAFDRAALDRAALDRAAVDRAPRSPRRGARILGRAHMSRHPQVTLVLGGARSGKSRFAEACARDSGLLRTYIATATVAPGDQDMAQRISRHRRDRADADWTTVEEPLELATVLSAHRQPSTAVVVDCLTLWCSNLLTAGRSIDEETARLCDVLRATVGPVILVSNELGMGIHPATAVGRDFRDHHGRMNQSLAAVADRVRLLVAGIPMAVKG